MSTTATSAAPREWTAPALGNLLVAAAILGLFVLACVGSASRKDTHASYVAHVQHTSDMWPALEHMRLFDPQTFRFTRRSQLPQPSAAVLRLARGHRPQARRPAAGADDVSLV